MYWSHLEVHGVHEIVRVRALAVREEVDQLAGRRDASRVRHRPLPRARDLEAVEVHPYQDEEA